MTIQRFVIAAGLVSALGVAGLVATARSQDQAPFGTAEDITYSQTLWDRLNEANLAGDNAVNTVPYEGTEPHGSFWRRFIVISRSTAIRALSS